MAISDRINEMYTHVGDVYDTITNVDLPTNKNIQNIPSSMRSSYLEIMNNGIDKIWNNWEKVTGEGETITLNSTEEAPMKIDLKGNTSQETTTGKNLIPTQTDLWEQGSISGNDGKNIDSTIRLRTKEYYPISNDTDYYVSIQNSDYCFVNIILYNSNKIYIGQYYNISSDINGTRSKLINIPSASRPNTAYYRATVRKIDNTATITANEIEIAKPQIELGSTATDWEKYVGGVPSPNPDYPQDIHVVSGDNSINVCGKNLFDGGDTATTNGITFTKHSDGSYDIVGTATSPAYILNYVPLAESGIVNGETYTISSNQNLTGLEIRIESYNGNTWLRATLGGLITFPKTHSADVTGATHVRFGLFVSSGTTINLKNVKIQLEKGTTDTEYEPHQSASYPISLGVENLLQNNLTSGTNNGITYVVNEDKSVTLNGTATAITWLILNSSVTLEAGTYTMTSGYSGNDVRVYSTGLGVYTLDGQRTVTKTSSVSGDVAINIPSGTICNNLTIKPMIEKGSKANSYTPYGTTPIELCKIGDYQDSIKKSTGKNLFDKNSIEEGKRLGSDGLPFTDTSFDLSDYIKVDSNTQYTYSRGSNGSGSSAIAYYDSSKTFISRTMPIMDSNAREVVLTTPNNATYVRIADLKTTLDSMQFEKGSSSSSYEPYGKVWYLNKQIGKYTITGQESDRQYYWSSEINGIKFVLDDAIKTVANVPTYCNRFNQWYSGTTANNYVRLNRTTSYLGFWFGNITIEGVNSITTFKSYATNNQILLYYPLATPTYTEITDSTLLSQLEAVKRSYDGQTNITQVNNDLPFILDVTALKQFTQ